MLGKRCVVVLGAALLAGAGCSSSGNSAKGGSGAQGGSAGYEAGAWAGGATSGDASTDASAGAGAGSGGTNAGGTAGTGAVDAGGSAGAGAAGAGGSSSPPPKCGARAKVGYYCGGDKVVNADRNTRYHCNGPGAPTSARKCPYNCVVAPAGYDDYCSKVPPAPTKVYRLPWTHGVTMKLTQDCNDPCCNDHVGPDEYAWDWANGNHFVVRAARGGTITHMKLSSSTADCTVTSTNTCSPYVNMIVVDHGDGTQSIYMHLEHNSAKAGITCGAYVKRGQALAVSGTTGHSTGIHLHFQVSQVHPGVATCECGKDGLHCAPSWNPFPHVWVNSTFKTVPISFEEWPAASKCNDRRITMPQSLN